MCRDSNSLSSADNLTQLALLVAAAGGNSTFWGAPYPRVPPVFFMLLIKEIERHQREIERLRREHERAVRERNLI